MNLTTAITVSTAIAGGLTKAFVSGMIPLQISLESTILVILCVAISATIGYFVKLLLHKLSLYLGLVPKENKKEKQSLFKQLVSMIWKRKKEIPEFANKGNEVAIEIIKPKAFISDKDKLQACAVILFRNSTKKVLTINRASVVLSIGKWIIPGNIGIHHSFSLPPNSEVCFKIPPIDIPWDIVVTACFGHDNLVDIDTIVYNTYWSKKDYKGFPKSPEVVIKCSAYSNKCLYEKSKKIA